MWVPDHLDRFGNLVAAHFYYLRVRNDGFNVQDAFEIEDDLNNPTGVPRGAGGGLSGGGFGGSGGVGAATPWVYKE